MTNNSTERAPDAGKGKKTGNGTTEKELGVRWGLTKGESNQKGRATRNSAQAQQIPGGLEPAQEEQEVQPDEGLDQLAGASGDRPDLDQPAHAGGDRSENRGLDQSEKSDGDRLSEREGARDDSQDRPLSYTSDEAGRKFIRKSESFEIEEDLLDDYEIDNEYEYTTRGPQDEDDSRIKKNEKKSGELEPDKQSKQTKTVEKRRRSAGSHEKHGDHKGKQPVRPAGFRDLISSISRAGQGKTVSRHDKLKAPTAVTFGRGKDNIPHGLKFNANKERLKKGTNRKIDESDTSESDESPSSDDSGEDEDPGL